MLILNVVHGCLCAAPWPAAAPAADLRLSLRPSLRSRAHGLQLGAAPATAQTACFPACGTALCAACLSPGALPCACLRGARAPPQAATIGTSGPGLASSLPTGPVGMDDVPVAMLLLVPAWLPHRACCCSQTSSSLYCCSASCRHARQSYDHDSRMRKTSKTTLDTSNLLIPRRAQLSPRAALSKENGIPQRWFQDLVATAESHANMLTPGSEQLMLVTTTTSLSCCCF